jgi:hypothetical protein
MTWTDPAAPDETTPERPPSAPAVRLAFSPVLWRLTLLFTGSYELLVVVWLRQNGLPWGQSLAISIGYLPIAVIFSFIWALVLTVIFAVVVRLVLRPMIALWYRPRVGADDGMLLFHLPAGESVLESCPARMVRGWHWPAGTLVRTNRQTWFLRRAWDAEPRSVDPKSLVCVALAPGPRPFGGMVQGLPPLVKLHRHDGTAVEFAVADPHAVAGWFQGRLPVVDLSQIENEWAPKPVAKPQWEL